MTWHANSIVTTRTYRVDEWNNVLKFDLIVRLDRKPVEFQAYVLSEEGVDFPLSSPLSHVITDDEELALRRSKPAGFDLFHDEYGTMANGWLDTLVKRELWDLGHRVFTAEGKQLSHPYDFEGSRNLTQYDDEVDVNSIFKVQRWHEEYGSVPVPCELLKIEDEGDSKYTRLTYVGKDTPYSYTSNSIFLNNVSRVFVWKGGKTTEVKPDKWDTLRGAQIVGMYPELIPAPTRTNPTNEDVRTVLELTF